MALAGIATLVARVSKKRRANKINTKFSLNRSINSHRSKIMYFVICGALHRNQLSVGYYGPFASMEVLKLWMESHLPINSNPMQMSFCDNGISRGNHTFTHLIDPIKGVSKRAEVDVTHAITGI